MFFEKWESWIYSGPTPGSVLLWSLLVVFRELYVVLRVMRYKAKHSLNILYNLSEIRGSKYQI